MLENALGTTWQNTGLKVLIRNSPEFKLPLPCPAPASWLWPPTPSGHSSLMENLKKKRKKKTLIGKLKWKSWGHARAAQKYGACMSDQPQKWGRSVPCTPRQGWGVTQGETNASLEVTLHLPAETRILVLISKSLALCGVRP